MEEAGRRERRTFRRPGEVMDAGRRRRLPRARPRGRLPVRGLIRQSPVPARVSVPLPASIWSAPKPRANRSYGHIRLLRSINHGLRHSPFPARSRHDRRNRPKISRGPDTRHPHVHGFPDTGGSPASRQFHA